MWKLLWLIWLALLQSAFGFAIPNEMAFSAPLATAIAHDEQNTAKNVYDVVDLADFHYDSAAVLNTSEEANRTSGASNLFGKIANFLAAETTAGGIGPVLQGQRGVAQAIAPIESEGGTVLGSEITVDAGGVRARPDLLVQNADGSINFVEVKTGGGRLTPNQQVVYPLIEQGGAVPAGANAANAGLQPGVALPSTPVRIIRFP